MGLKCKCATLISSNVEDDAFDLVLPLELPRRATGAGLVTFLAEGAAVANAARAGGVEEDEDDSLLLRGGGRGVPPR